MSSIIKKLVAAALAALGVSCAWIGSRTEDIPRQDWQVPLTVQLKLSKTAGLSAGESVNAVVTLKNRTDQPLDLLVIDGVFYVTARDPFELYTLAEIDSNDLAVKQSANTLLLYPSPNLEYRQGQVEIGFKANGSFSSGDLPVTFSRAGTYFVRGLVRAKVQNAEENSEAEVMLYSRYVVVNVKK